MVSERIPFGAEKKRRRVATARDSVAFSQNLKCILVNRYYYVSISANAHLSENQKD